MSTQMSRARRPTPAGRGRRGRRPRRRLPARRQHPQRLQTSYCLPGRAGRHHRPQRRRQVDAAQGAVRPGQGPLRHGHARRRGHHQPAGRHAGRRGRRLRAADQQRLPVADHRGEPARWASTSGPKKFTRALRRSSCDLFPALGDRRNQRAGVAVRRRAADGRDGPGADDGAVGAAARRAVGRPVPGAAGRGVRPHPPDQQGRRLGHHGRAERPPLPADLRPRLRARPGPQRLHRHRPRAGRTTRRSSSSTSARSPRTSRPSTREH